MLLDAIFFQSLDLFAAASLESLTKISEVARKQFYKKETLILNRTEAQDSFVYVLKGWIKLCKESTEGEDIVLDILPTHSYCGDPFIDQPKKNPTYSIHAISDIELVKIPLTVIKQAILNDHGLALSFLQYNLQKA